MIGWEGSSEESQFSAVVCWFDFEYDGYEKSKAKLE